MRKLHVGTLLLEKKRLKNFIIVIVTYNINFRGENVMITNEAGVNCFLYTLSLHTIVVVVVCSEKKKKKSSQRVNRCKLITQENNNDLTRATLLRVLFA